MAYRNSGQPSVGGSGTPRDVSPNLDVSRQRSRCIRRPTHSRQGVAGPCEFDSEAESPRAVAVPDGAASGCGRGDDGSQDGEAVPTGLSRSNHRTALPMRFTVTLMADTAPQPDPTHRRTIVGRPRFAGTVGAVVFLWASFWPTLMPRTFVTQGAMSGLSAAIGYAIFTLFGWLAGLVLSHREFSIGASARRAGSCSWPAGSPAP